MGKAHSKLSVDTLNELQKVTHFDKKEIQKWYLGFVAESTQQHHNIYASTSTSTSTAPISSTNYANIPSLASTTIDGNTVVLKQQQQSNQAYWTKHDMNRLYAQFFPFGNPLPFSQIMFNMYDLDRNGKIEFHEFILSLSVVARGKFDEKLICMFVFIPHHVSCTIWAMNRDI